MINSKLKECYMCGKVTKLCKAHIVPLWCYSRHDNETYRAIGDSIDYPKKAPMGAYSTEILCSCCDNNILGKLYDCKSKLIFDSIINHCDRHKSDTTFEVPLPADDIKVIIKFALSILWRADIDPNNAIGGQVSLGKYRDIIKEIITEKSNLDNRTQVFIAKYDYSEGTKFDKRVAINKLISKKKKYTHYIIDFKGFSINIKVSNSQLEPNYKQLILDPNANKIKIMSLDFYNSPAYRATKDLVQKYKK